MELSCYVSRLVIFNALFAFENKKCYPCAMLGRRKSHMKTSRAPYIIGINMIVLKIYTCSPFLPVCIHTSRRLCLGEFQYQPLCFLGRTTHHQQSESVAGSNFSSSLMVKPLRRSIFPWLNWTNPKHSYISLIRMVGWSQVFLGEAP